MAMFSNYNKQNAIYLINSDIRYYVNRHGGELTDQDRRMIKGLTGAREWLGGDR